MRRVALFFSFLLYPSAAFGAFAVDSDAGKIYPVIGASSSSGDIESVVAGAGMTGGATSGDATLNVIGTADRITVNADSVDIAATYAGQASITTLGTIVTGVWDGTDVADSAVSDTLTIGASGSVHDSAIPSGVTRDTEWDTIAEINTASTDADIISTTSAWTGGDLGGTGLAATVGANAVALGTDTTNNYVATIADSGASEVTVANSGSETAAVTLALAAGITRDTEWNTIDFLVGTATASLSGEIVAGTAPNGELGGTWASPTIDDTITVTGWTMGASFATTPAADDNDTSLATSAYVQTEINAMGGRSLTAASGLMDADAELYTDRKTIWFESPVAADDFKTIWSAPQAATITGISCESDQTVNFDLQVDDGTPTGVNGSDIACTSTWAEDTVLAGDATLAAGDRLDLAITSVSGTPTWVSITWKFTYDD